MGSTRLILSLLISLSSPIFLVAYLNQQKTLTDLRRFKVKAVAGRFTVDRSVLKRELQNRKQQDAACGQDVKIFLPRSLPHAPYNTSHQGEIAFVYGSITDQTLADELSNDIKEQVATSYNIFTVDISVVLGKKEKHGVLSVHVFTNSTKKIIPPYFTNYKGVTYVDSIEEKDDGTVTIRLGDDVMVYWWQEVKSKDQNKVGEDFDKVFGEVIAATNYPLPFDWGCQFLGFHTSFCQALNEVQCELTAVGGDVCALTSTSSSERLPTTMKIVNMTGIFRDMFPFLVETVPIESFEAEVAEREHTTGITFPCLSR